ncbi:hypothetical protein BJF84_20990 [Rhodococcus sp. CUA-806]|nr:hypothetical protein BJF84_20990 [Rhodococcus sp. CUA-806]
MNVAPAIGSGGRSSAGERGRTGSRRRIVENSAWIRIVSAAASGLLMYASFPPMNFWVGAPLAVALLVLAVRGRSARAGAGYGLVAGLTFFAPLLPWVGEYVGSTPWLALAAIQALFVALFGAVADRMSRLPCGPIWVASAWVAMEAVRSRVPFGGFPWGRIAFGQADGPLLPLAALAGAPGLSFVVVLIGSALTHVVVADRRRLALAAASFAGMSVVVGVLTMAAPLSLRRSRTRSRLRWFKAMCRGSGSTSTRNGGRFSTTTSSAPLSSPPTSNLVA